MPGELTGESSGYLAPLEGDADSRTPTRAKLRTSFGRGEPSKPVTPDSGSSLNRMSWGETFGGGDGDAATMVRRSAREAGAGVTHPRSSSNGFDRARRRKSTERSAFPCVEQLLIMFRMKHPHGLPGDLNALVALDMLLSERSVNRGRQASRRHAIGDESHSEAPSRHAGSWEDGARGAYLGPRALRCEQQRSRASTCEKRARHRAARGLARAARGRPGNPCPAARELHHAARPHLCPHALRPDLVTCGSGADRGDRGVHESVSPRVGRTPCPSPEEPSWLTLGADTGPFAASEVAARRRDGTATIRLRTRLRPFGHLRMRRR